MRVILTILAVALVTLLTAALVVPYFIDWSAHRDEIAARLEPLVGGPVTLSGPVTLRLLPTPYLEAGAGSAAGEGPDAPKLSFAGVRLELALVKLASGALRFTEARLEQPALTLVRRADGALVLPAPAAGAFGAIGFDRFTTHDGTIRIVAPSGAPEGILTGVDLDGAAPSLAGPFRLTGQAVGPGGALIVFRLATEKADDAGAPARLTIDAGPTWPGLQFDGKIASSGANGPTASGAAVVSGMAPGLDGPAPWRAAGQLVADLDGATLTAGDFRFGPEERALKAEGSAALTYRRAIRFAIAVKAKQMNVDALLRRKGEDAVPPTRALGALTAALQPALGGGLTSLDARLTVESAILGGDAVSGVAGSLKAEPGAPLKTRFDLGLPGRTRLTADGEVETGDAARFLGRLDFSTADAGALGRWAGEGAPAVGLVGSAVAAALPAPNLAFAGDVEAAAVGFSAKNARIGLGRSTLTGALAVTRPVGGDPGRIYADLSAGALDVEALPNLEAAGPLVGDYDLKLALDVEALSVAHLGEAGIDGAALRLKVGKTGPKITLDELSLAGLGGASLQATGTMGPEGATATGRLDAAKLKDFARLVNRLAPGPWSQALNDRADALQPASIAFEATGGPSSGGAPSLAALTANGTVGGAQATLSLKPAEKGDGQAFALTLDSPASGALLRQIGIGRGGAPGGGPGHVEIKASGAAQRGFDVDASAALAGTRLSAHGRYVPTAEGDAARLFGALKLEGDNLAPFAALVGFAAPGGTIGPVAASADVTWRGERVGLTRIAANVAGVKVAGELAYEPPPAPVAANVSADVSRAEEVVNGPAAASAAPSPPALSGSLAVDRLRLVDLASLTLGAPTANAKFAPPPLILPPAAVKLGIGALNLVDGLSAEGFAANLRLDPGRLDLDDMAMKVAGGAVAGRASLRRSGESATLDGSLAVGPLLVKRAVFSGRVGARFDFASTGRSAGALIAGLAGGGAAEFSGASLMQSDPDALRKVVAGAEAPDASIDETNVSYRLGAALDAGALLIPDGEAPLALSAGTIRLGPLAIARAQGSAALSASLVLSTLALETRVMLTMPAAGLKFWSGPPPSATVTVADALGAPKRRIDVAGLSAGLATQAITRESDRIDALEADIRERAFFNRRLKGERFLDRREQEVEDWRAEQERLRGLAEHLSEQRAEEARQAAEKAAAERAAQQATPAPESAPDPANPPPATILPPARPKPPEQTERRSEPTAGGLY